MMYNANAILKIISFNEIYFICEDKAEIRPPYKCWVTFCSDLVGFFGVLFWFFWYLQRKSQRCWGEFSTYIFPSSGCSSRGKAARTRLHTSILGTKEWQDGGKETGRQTFSYQEIKISWWAVWRQRYNATDLTIFSWKMQSILEMLW